MGTTIFKILTIIGSLAFFIYGMKMMSDGIQRAAGSQLRAILRAMTKNRYLGVFTGFLITAIVQSSSATTVMTVSFVNAGLLTLLESAGVMMGANIGTTVTGWIISILGFKLSLSTLSIPIFAIGVPMLFSGKGKLKYWGEFLIGFAILFLGLTFLKDYVPDLDQSSPLLQWVKDFSNYGFISRVVFVLVGALVTIIVQSSSAAMAITLTLVYSGWLPIEVAAAMVLGENIGTTITAELASLVGNLNAKRSARIHSLFNVIGVTWMIFLLPVVLPYITTFVENFTHLFDGHVKVEDSLTQDNQLATYTLAAFHTFFNLTNVLLLIGFVNVLVRVAEWSVKPSAEDEEDDTGLKFISSLARTPELAIVEVQKETAHFGSVVSRMSLQTKELLNTSKNKVKKKMLKKIKKYEKISDEMEIEITEYVTKIANEELTPKTSLKLRSILNICNDLERIGDIYYQISKTIEMKDEQELNFNDQQIEYLNQMNSKLEEAFAVMVENLNADRYENVTKEKAVQLERELNALRNKLRNYNLSSLGKENYDVKVAMMFNNTFSAMEKVGDHIINVTESVVGEI